MPGRMLRVIVFKLNLFLFGFSHWESDWSGCVGGFIACGSRHLVEMRGFDSLYY